MSKHTQGIYLMIFATLLLLSALVLHHFSEVMQYFGYLSGFVVILIYWSIFAKGVDYYERGQ